MKKIGCNNILQPWGDLLLPAYQAVLKIYPVLKRTEEIEPEIAFMRLPLFKTG
jgi:hypothetical protein